MHLTLTVQQTVVLRDLLHAYLPELRREVARTEVKEFRRVLLDRQDLCEFLLSQVERQEDTGQPERLPLDRVSS